MKQQLLRTEGKSEIIVDSIEAIDYDVHYDFNSQKLTPDPIVGRKKKISTYLISKELADAVNAAIVTGRPLLIKGEPGSGKSKLAQAVAAYFFGEEAYKYYFEWHVKSRSRAMEGGYVFDHVGRLRDATIASKDAEAAERSATPAYYTSLGAMGKVFKSIDPKGRKPILLIDEIDKGDIDFPNDLLLELDEMRFKINEMPGTYIEAPRDMAPLVFITSNNERDLPPAFLRRCLYYYIPPFDEPLLSKISISRIKDIYEELGIQGDELLADDKVKEFVKAFLLAKESANNKPPSTSEMLDWLKLITFKSYHEKLPMDQLIGDKALRDLALKLNA